MKLSTRVAGQSRFTGRTNGLNGLASRKVEMVTIDVSKTDLTSVRSVFSTEPNLLNLRIEKYENRLAAYEKIRNENVPGS